MPKTQQHQNIKSDINLESNEIFGLSFANVSKYELIDQYIKRYIETSKSQYSKTLVVFTPNPEQIVLSTDNPEFEAALRKADILLPDGVGIVLVSSLRSFFGRGRKVQQRVTGIDVVVGILHNNPNAKVVVIGGKAEDSTVSVPKTVELAGTLQGKTVRWLPGYKNIAQPTASEEAAVVEFLRNEKPDVVLVAFGAPYQEYWTLQHLPLLQELHVALVMVIGGALDVLRGRLHRAPKAMRAVGLEWLFRLIQEPWRWRRQLQLLRFIQLSIREVLR